MKYVFWRHVNSGISTACHDPRHVRDCAIVAKKKKSANAGHPPKLARKPLSLKKLADRLGLSPATVSLVINRSPVADTIPQATKDRIFAAARKYNYRPNFYARSLRTRRSFTIGVLVPEVSEGYAAAVLSGIEEYLLQEGYFYFVASHRHRADLIDEYPRLLLDRSVDGLIGVDTPWHHNLPVPVVTVSGHNGVKGVTNIVLNHDRAAELALKHLFQLGHRKIAFLKGQEFSSDTEARWASIEKAARGLALPIAAKRVVQLEGESPSPGVGQKATKKLLHGGRDFTALFTFNDISAFGAIRALREAGVRVPEDVSVVGFDDIQNAAYQNPALTTVRQPLREMGRAAAEILLRRINRPGSELHDRHMVEPELVVRESTCRVASKSGVRMGSRRRRS
jgi:DNA-binding LacI/PurR family transcriptional regulator